MRVIEFRKEPERSRLYSDSDRIVIKERHMTQEINLEPILLPSLENE